MPEYYAANVSERALSPNGLFSEEAYRERYPDVVAAIQRGGFKSGFLHFVYHGADDGRCNLPGFNLSVSRQDSGPRNEIDYLASGFADLRQVVPWFDEAFYLAVYDDAHELKRREVIRSGLEHFLVLGFAEGRIPHPGMLDTMAQAETGNAWRFFAALNGRPSPHVEINEASRLLHHLVGKEQRKSRQLLAMAIWPFVTPPPLGGRFDEWRYLALHKDVALALRDQPPGAGAQHWRNDGILEQRAIPGTNVFAQRMLRLQDFLNWRSGVNFFGPFSAPSGLGGAARGFVAALRSADIPVDTIDVSWLIARDMPLDLVAPTDLAYSINFFFLNPDQVLPFVQRFGTAMFDGRASVASWVWELPSPRPEWRAAVSAFDLIITPSEFCTQSFASFTGRPVVTCPYVVDETLLKTERQKSNGNSWITRIEQEKAAGKRIILFIMDASSYIARKGIDVFLAMARRFEAERPGRCLFVLKTHSRDHSKSTYRVHGNCVLVINEVFEFPDLLRLKSIVDIYVSPHRSEGFGLNIFESIVFGVPALCSRYGGGVDRLPEDYPYFIPGELAEVGRDMGPYRRHAIWFEPSVDAACQVLARMLDGKPQNGRFQQVVRSA